MKKRKIMKIMEKRIKKEHKNNKKEIQITNGFKIINQTNKKNRKKQDNNKEIKINRMNIRNKESQTKRLK